MLYLLKNKKILTIHLINYIDLNSSWHHATNLNSIQIANKIQSQYI